MMGSPMNRHLFIAAALLATLVGIGAAASQSASFDTRALAALSDAELMKLPAKKLFSSFDSPASSMKSRPIGFYAKGFDGRIDDPKGGWKARGLWTTNGDRTPWLIEGGKGTRPLAAHFQIRANPIEN